MTINQLELLSRISNAVLTPELNCNIPLDCNTPKGAKYHASKGLPISEHDKTYRVQWCRDQLKKIGNFGAVFIEENRK